MHFVVMEEEPIRAVERHSDPIKFHPGIQHVFELRNRTRFEHPCDHIRYLINLYQLENAGNKPKQILLGGIMYEAVLWTIYKMTGSVKTSTFCLLDVEVLLDGSRDDCSIRMIGSAEEELIKLSKLRKGQGGQQC